MKPARSRATFALLLILASLALGMIGCSTTDPDNMSSRPWNAPQNWETGSLPGSINQGH
jgi:hypothetical protein